MKTIQLRTEVPAKVQSAGGARESRHSARPQLVTPIFAAKAEGAWIEDVDGNRTWILPAAIGCLNIGIARLAWKTP